MSLFESCYCALLTVSQSSIVSSELINISMPQAPSMHHCMLPTEPDFLANWDYRGTHIFTNKCVHTYTHKVSDISLRVLSRSAKGEGLQTVRGGFNISRLCQKFKRTVCHHTQFFASLVKLGPAKRNKNIINCRFPGLCDQLTARCRHVAVDINGPLRQSP